MSQRVSGSEVCLVSDLGCRRQGDLGQGVGKSALRVGRKVFEGVVYGAKAVIDVLFVPI